jgi:hypothetical protein
MIRLTYDDNWPESWKLSHAYDEVEVWGSRRDIGHAYQYRVRRDWSIRCIEKLIPPGSEILDVAGAPVNFLLPWRRG